MNKQLTIDELRAYQAGQLDGPARHRVERLLLEDPFYADALEGLEALQRTGASLPKQTAQLRRALHERINESATEQRLFPLWVTTMAASILLVIGVSLYFIFANRTTSQPVAQQPRQLDSEGMAIEMGPQDSAIHKTVETIAVIESHTKHHQAETTQANRPSSLVFAKNGLEKPSNATKKVDTKNVTSTNGVSSNPQSFTALIDAAEMARILQSRTELNVAAAPTAQQHKAEGSYTAAQQQLAQPAGTSLPMAASFTKLGATALIQGVITDKGGNPLPGVNIIVKGSQTGVTTDVKGHFVLDSLLVKNKVLVASYIGFNIQEFPASALSKGPIRLSEDTKALSEVVIVGYDKPKRQAKRSTMAIAPSAPLSTSSATNSETIWVTELNDSELQAFREYVNNQASPSFQGPLSVRIRTNSNGSVQRVSIEEGILVQEPGQKKPTRRFKPSPEAKAEAERLVRQYSHWPHKRQWLLWAMGWPPPAAR